MQKTLLKQCACHKSFPAFPENCRETNCKISSNRLKKLNTRCLIHGEMHNPWIGSSNWFLMCLERCKRTAKGYQSADLSRTIFVHLVYQRRLVKFGQRRWPSQFTLCLRILSNCSKTDIFLYIVEPHREGWRRVCGINIQVFKEHFTILCCDGWSCWEKKAWLNILSARSGLIDKKFSQNFWQHLMTNKLI